MKKKKVKIREKILQKCFFLKNKERRLAALVDVSRGTHAVRCRDM